MKLKTQTIFTASLGKDEDEGRIEWLTNFVKKCGGNVEALRKLIDEQIKKESQ